MTNSFKREIILKLLNIETLLGLREISEFLMKAYMNKFNLDYENCKCRKNTIGKLVEECIENIDGNEMIYNGTSNNYEKVCNSCTKT